VEGQLYLAYLHATPEFLMTGKLLLLVENEKSIKLDDFLCHDIHSVMIISQLGLYIKCSMFHNFKGKGKFVSVLS
jgi:hypothetical protein